MDKSYVTMSQKVCMVCDKPYDDGSLLLDTRLKKTFESKTVTGIGLCPDHDKEGYVALIEIDESKSKFNGDTISPEDAYRTGGFAQIREEAFDGIFGFKPHSKINYVGIGVLSKLQEMVDNG